MLEDLSTDFSLGQLRNTLSEIPEICLMEDDIFRDAGKRSQLISIYKTIERLGEAVFVIVHQRQWNGR